MPYKVTKLRNENKYKVTNIETGKIMSHHTTKENAMKQLKVLHIAMNNETKSKKKKTNKKNKIY